MKLVRSFAEFRARRFLIDQLMRPVKAGRIVHAQLFAGPDGVGKRSAALLLARMMNCVGQGEKPCNECRSCRQFLSGNAPGLIMVESEKNVIRVNAVRELIGKVQLRPESGVVTVVIDGADKMNESAENALLKTLEEAPEYVAFILITDKPGALLPTIRSRCAMYRFAPLSETEVREILVENGVSPERAAEEAARAEGSPGRAMERIENDGYKALCARALSALRGVKKPGDVAGAFQKIQNDKDSAGAILEAYEFEARSLMNAQGGARERGERLMESVITARKQLKANVAFQSVMEILFFDAAQEDA